MLINFITKNWIIKAVKNKKVILEAENREAGRKGGSSFFFFFFFFFLVKVFFLCSLHSNPLVGSSRPPFLQVGGVKREEGKEVKKGRLFRLKRKKMRKGHIRNQKEKEKK